MAALTHSDIEISDAEAVRRTLTDARPDVVVNTAAMHNVEQCELDPERAFAVNAFGARNIAMTCGRIGATTVHVSTDYVFGGDKREPYAETDLPRPLSVYGNSKLAGEQFVAAENPKHYVVRTSALYGVNRCRAKTSDNFVRLMLRLAREKGEVRVVADERVSPSWTADVAEQILDLAASGGYGLYHVTSQGEVSWYDFARSIFEATGLNVRMDVATAADFHGKVRRPAYSILDNAALRARNLDRMPHWRDALRRYLETIGELSHAQSAPGGVRGASAGVRAG